MRIVHYRVDSVDESLPFCRALGFRLRDRWGQSFAIVKRRDLTWWLIAPEAAMRMGLDVEDHARQRRFPRRAIVEVADLDATLDKLAAQGVYFHGPPITTCQGRQVLVDDPAGRLVELIEPTRQPRNDARRARAPAAPRQGTVVESRC